MLDLKTPPEATRKAPRIIRLEGTDLDKVTGGQSIDRQIILDNGLSLDQNGRCPPTLADQLL
jgi:hypothetical protein